MSFFVNFLFYANFAFYVVCSTIMLLLNSTLRPNAKVRIPLSVLLVFAGVFISTFIDNKIGAPPFISSSIFSLFIYLFCIATILLAFYISVDSSIVSLILCVAVGYTIKQASESVIYLFQYIPGFPSYFDPDKYTLIKINFIKFPVFLVTYLLIYLLGIKKYIKLSPPDKISGFSYISIILTTLLCLILNLFRGNNSTQSMILDITSIIYGFGCCMLAIMTYFGLLESTNYKKENAMMQKIWEEQEIQLDIFRQSINEIEIKYHDLKRNLLLLKERKSEYADDLITDIEYSLGNFDSKIETGNITFDTLVTRYRMQCLNSGVRLSIIADGKLLDFMTSTDIVALMGNVIENAIEAVSELPANERSISLSITETMGFVAIHEENPYTGNILFEKGEMISSKADKKSHGFGTKSIDLITKKYGGTSSFNTDDNLFSLNILFKKDTPPR